MLIKFIVSLHGWQDICLHIILSMPYIPNDMLLFVLKIILFTPMLFYILGHFPTTTGTNLLKER